MLNLFWRPEASINWKHLAENFSNGANKTEPEIRTFPLIAIWMWRNWMGTTTVLSKSGNCALIRGTERPSMCSSTARDFPREVRTTCSLLPFSNYQFLYICTGKGRKFKINLSKSFQIFSLPDIGIIRNILPNCQWKNTQHFRIYSLIWLFPPFFPCCLLDRVMAAKNANSIWPKINFTLICFLL